MSYDINSLNEEQLNPLKQIEGAVLVTAGAGSGKTRLLTHRVAYLIKDLGVNPYNILAITFTNKAAGEMKERISKMVDGADGVWISTFHSMCARILRRDISVMYPYDKNFTIYSQDDSEKVVKELLSERSITDDKVKKSVTFHLSNWKNSSQSLEDYLTTHEDENDIRKIGLIINEYENRLKKNNALDFDDLLRKTMKLFKEYPDVLEHYAKRFKFILVDEFQDTNTVQYDLVKMLASVHGNVFAVGDEDQCIYSWRGANFQNIFNFKKDFPDCKVFKLERNYRSTSGILTVANNVIKNNSARLDKKMWTDKEQGQVPELYNSYDERDEALYVAKNIEKLVANGYKYDEIAVLMRLNALSRRFEEAFLSYNIPHRIYGGFKFFERQEIRYIISYLRLFINKKDDISLLRVINFPKRGIGDGAIAKIKAIAGENSLLETILSPNMLDEQAVYRKLQEFVMGYLKLAEMPQSPISEFVEAVLKTFKLREAYNNKTEEDTNRLLNIESFVASVKEFEKANPDMTLGDYLETITLISDTDEIGENGAVTIATVHAVKGLEFKAVFVIGLEEGIFPIQRASNPSDMEEERRLLYVAITRAEEVLYMSHCSKRYMYGQSQYQAPSRFIRELGLLSLSMTKSAKTDFASGNGYSSGGGYKSNSSYKKSWTNDNFDEGNGFGASSDYSTGGGFGFKHNDFMKNLNNQKPKIEETLKKDVSIFKIGQKVEHPKYGVGEIIEITPDGLVGDIIFEDFGKKSLMLELAPLEILD